MAMEWSCGVVNGSVYSFGDESVMIDNNAEENENPANLIEDFDSYWDYINARLTILRMVSDSVIKGMANAIEQEAAEKISEKELELVRLKDSLHLYHLGAEESQTFKPLVVKHESGSVKHGSYSSLSDYDRIGESMGSLKMVANEQLKNLGKQIACIKGSSSLRRIGSGSEMVGLGGILQDKVSDVKWMDVDKTLDTLRTTIDTICKLVDNMVYLSKASLCQWQQEKEFQGEIEDMVIMICFRSLKEEIEERLWGQSARFYDNESLNWLEKVKEISSLREELNAISISLSVPEIRHLTSHGLMEMGEEWDTNKRTDHLQCKTSSDHVMLSTSLSEGNGKPDELVIVMPENLDFKLKRMSKEELVNHFKTEMTEMKTNHELKVTEMTEEHFALKREYLKERGPSLPIKKDKELDILRKRIPEVLSKLDDILVENEKLPTFSENAEGFCNFKGRLESLLSENHQLRSLLTDKKNEVKRLSLQVSNTAEIMLQHSLAEETLVKRNGNLQGALDDARIEASISEGVYKCLLRDAVDSIKSVCEESDFEYKHMQEVYQIIFSDAAHNAIPSSTCAFEDSDLESVIMQELCEVIFREALKEAEVKLNELNQKYCMETEFRRLEVAEKERLKQETYILSSLVEEKEKLVMMAMESVSGVSGSKQKTLGKQAFASLMSKTKGKKPAMDSPEKGAIPSPTPRITRYQRSLLSSPKGSSETTPTSFNKRKHLEAFSSNSDVVELDPITGGVAPHLGRYVHFLGEHLTPEDSAEMSRRSLLVSVTLLESVTGAIKACQYVSLPSPHPPPLLFLSDLPPFYESSVVLSAHAKCEEQMAQLKRECQRADRRWEEHLEEATSLLESERRKWGLKRRK